MRIDAYTHFFPKKFFDKLDEVATDYKDMGKRVRSLPALVRSRRAQEDRRRPQGLSANPRYPQPPIEKFAKTPAQIDEFCRMINDGFAELCAKEKDHFPGWVAHVSLAARGRRRRPRRSARSKSSARSACRSTPTSPASRSTGPNICRSGTK